MRPLDRVLLVLDRTTVLFVGLAAGAVVATSFFPSAVPGGQAQASIPVPPAAATPLAHRAADPLPPRLVQAVQEGRPIRIGVFGDSFGDGVWAGLYNILRRDKGFEVDQFSERGTGFTRYRSLNLLDDIRVKLDRQPVDIAIVSFGANDTQGIFDQGHGNAYMSAGWQRIVTDRVSAVVGLLRARGAMVYWVGLPKMRDDRFDADIHQMNQFYAGRMAALGVPYYDTLPLSVDAQGRYEPYLPADRETGERRMARTNDGIHMTIPGYVHAMRGLADRVRGSIAQARQQAERQSRRATGAQG
ncbi:MAG TPA: DUF459 domain-containing protein [Allosphingosinicella sp.]|jgi:hypothetical protein|nr:DUF459 domain-containing protein [Allosphingosinicella sp.]